MGKLAHKLAVVRIGYGCLFLYGKLLRDTLTPKRHFAARLPLFEPKLRQIVDTSDTESRQIRSRQSHNARSWAGALNAVITPLKE
jgi:hypothetical protein